MIDGEPLKNDAAQRLIRDLVKTGTVTIPGYASRAMADDALSTYDVENVLRAGWVEMSEYEKGEWRYRVRTNRIVVIVAFEPDEVRVVTVWRL